MAITIKAAVAAQRFQPLWQNLVVWPQFWHLTVVSSNLKSKTQKKFGEVFAFQNVSFLNVTESKFLQNSCQYRVVYSKLRQILRSGLHYQAWKSHFHNAIQKQNATFMPESIQLDRVRQKCVECYQKITKYIMYQLFNIQNQ